MATGTWIPRLRQYTRLPSPLYHLLEFVSTRLCYPDGREARTGCFTCRARHVKCGEEKPTCQRCCDVGRPCGGYKALNKGYTSTLRLYPAVLPSLMPVQNAVERRYFNYFRQYTISDLAGYDSKSYFWNYIVLQTCHASPAVLHAALALGALQEHTYSGSTTLDDKIKRSILQQSKQSYTQSMLSKAKTARADCLGVLRGIYMSSQRPRRSRRGPPSSPEWIEHARRMASPRRDKVDAITGDLCAGFLSTGHKSNIVS